MLKYINTPQIVFHFNKAHLADPKIPMWVVKVKGETHYIDHVDSNVGFSTKETPDNEHTKGSIKFKDRSIEIYTKDNKQYAHIF